MRGFRMTQALRRREPGTLRTMTHPAPEYYRALAEMLLAQIRVDLPDASTVSVGLRISIAFDHATQRPGLSLSIREAGEPEQLPTGAAFQGPA